MFENNGTYFLWSFFHLTLENILQKVINLLQKDWDQTGENQSFSSGQWSKSPQIPVTWWTNCFEDSSRLSLYAEPLSEFQPQDIHNFIFFFNLPWHHFFLLLHSSVQQTFLPILLVVQQYYPSWFAIIELRIFPWLRYLGCFYSHFSSHE